MLRGVQPTSMMYVWDAIVAAFLFGWSITLMVDLQQSEMLSLKNLLHLPISLRGGFFLNYASSLVSLVILALVPGMLGLCVGSVVRFGAPSIVTFVLLLSFLFMVTAATYLVRGYLARLMENKRTRGTVIAVMTIFFVGVTQLPALLSQRAMMGSNRQLYSEEQNAEQAELIRQNGTLEISAEEFQARWAESEAKFAQLRKAESDAKLATLNQKAQLANACLPIGWLPYGACAAASGSMFAPWLCVLGMSGIGLGSLGLAYRNTLQRYTGQQSRRSRSNVISSAKTSGGSEEPVGGGIIEKSLPLLNDHQATVALMTFRSTTRAPEAKMALITPIIFICIFGASAMNGGLSSIPVAYRAVYTLCIIGISLISTAQLMLNAFALDRQGFRAYVLMPIKRCDILIGKNVGLLPLSLALGVLAIVAFGFWSSLPFSHTLASVMQCVIALALYSLVGNYSSIYATAGIAPGSMKPVEMSFLTVMRQFASILMIPVCLAPAGIAFGVEVLVQFCGWLTGVPIYLIITLVQLPIAMLFYRWLVVRQGDGLRRREQKILELISKVAD